METLFREISTATFNLLKSNELLTISYRGEISDFIRINESKVRQISHVNNGDIELELIIGNKKTVHEFSLTSDFNSNLNRIKFELNKMRLYINDLQDDPFIVMPKESESSRQTNSGALLKNDEILDAILPPLTTVDCSSIWASGKIFRGNANCKKIFHWFETENYSFDFSLVTKEEKMVKETYAGSHWNQKDYLSFIEKATMKLDSMKDKI